MKDKILTNSLSWGLKSWDIFYEMNKKYQILQIIKISWFLEDGEASSFSREKRKNYLNLKPSYPID
jgi:hypothetical protein